MASSFPCGGRDASRRLVLVLDHLVGPGGQRPHRPSDRGLVFYPPVWPSLDRVTGPCVPVGRSSRAGPRCPTPVGLKPPATSATPTSAPPCASRPVSWLPPIFRAKTRLGSIRSCTSNERIIARVHHRVVYLPSITTGGRRYGTRSA